MVMTTMAPCNKGDLWKPYYGLHASDPVLPSNGNGRYENTGAL